MSKITLSDQEFTSIIQNIAKKGANISVFEKNIVAIARYHVRLAKKILEIKANEEFKAFMGDDPLMFNIIKNDGSKFMYNNPLNEVKEQIEDFEKLYSRYPAVFIYGLGNGVFLKAILANQTHKNIIVFEPEIEILYIVLNIIDFSADLFADRLIIANTEFFGNVHFYAITGNAAVRNSARIYNLYVNTHFYDDYLEDMKQINEYFKNGFMQHMREAGNDSTDALIGMNHTTANIPAMIKGIAISSIVKKRKNKAKTAIVVSTGPSLSKQLKLLKKVQNHATIISVDASYPILKKHGIKPDYVTSIERVEATSKFFASKASEFDEGVIFVVASLTHAKTVEYLEGREYCLVMRPLGYEAGYKDRTYGYLGSGQSAAHLAMELGVLLEHEKIVLIGQDLAYGANGNSHADGHIFSSTSESNKTDKLETIAYGGEGKVVTRVVWNLFRNFFENYAAARKNKDRIRLINSTEGGARIAGFEEIPFKDMTKIMLKEEKTLAKVTPLSKAKQAQKLNKFKRHLGSILKYGKGLQNKATRLFKEVVKEIEKDKKLLEKGKRDRIDFEKLQKLAFKIDNFKDGLNDPRFMGSFYTIASPVILHQELEFAPILTRPSDTLEEKQDKLIEWVSLQAHWLFSLAGFIDVTSENLINNSESWL